MPQFEAEIIARELLALLERHFASPSVPVRLVLEGAGVHWHVEVRAEVRACRVSAFRYYRQEGTEYCLTLREGSQKSANGRTWSLEEALRVLQDWLVEAVPLQDLYARFPFLDRKKRELEALRRKVDAVLERLGSPRRCLLREPLGDFYTLTVNGEDRACELDALHGGSEARCTFLHLGTRLAEGKASDVDGLSTAISGWLDSGVRVEPLQREFPFIRIEPHAPAYEAGRYAEWRWDDAIARARESQGVKGWAPLVPLLPLLERMASRPIFRRFFFFTSHDTLCFSRCPRHPFSTEGLPYISPRFKGGPMADLTEARYSAHCGERTLEGGPEEICQFVEGILATEGDTTFYGSTRDAVDEDD
ncbi:DUF6193 family natural product biosynthesis protein [Pyxidicoccus trucidator]|uniref:DUF6193 family natural product biosynthesis protein n=1 Tax=Pyxidicoccus trucidator TaxID=2709662 RepID=UPI0013DD3CAB|nr:DUF6193 family natural product biosynthesis protein [Pyxidicoccus trucidator]